MIRKQYEQLKGNYSKLEQQEEEIKKDIKDINNDIEKERQKIQELKVKKINTKRQLRGVLSKKEAIEEKFKNEK